jgi:hypothetical protein
MTARVNGKRRAWSCKKGLRAKAISEETPSDAAVTAMLLQIPIRKRWRIPFLPLIQIFSFD